jgi:hypothetical protein
VDPRRFHQTLTLGRRLSRSASRKLLGLLEPDFRVFARTPCVSYVFGESGILPINTFMRFQHLF